MKFIVNSHLHGGAVYTYIWGFMHIHVDSFLLFKLFKLIMKKSNNKIKFLNIVFEHNV